MILEIFRFNIGSSFFLCFSLIFFFIACLRKKFRKEKLEKKKKEV